MKRKGAAVLATEPDKKRGRDQPKSPKSSRLFCAFHNLHTHNTNDYEELKRDPSPSSSSQLPTRKKRRLRPRT